MSKVTLDKARDELPALIKRALEGEEIVIEASDSAAVRLAPVTMAAGHTGSPGAGYRGRGALKGQLVVGPEFFDPLSDEECGVGDRSGTR